MSRYSLAHTDFRWNGRTLYPPPPPLSRFFLTRHLGVSIFFSLYLMSLAVLCATGPSQTHPALPSVGSAAGSATCTASTHPCSARPLLWATCGSVSTAHQSTTLASRSPTCCGSPTPSRSPPTLFFCLTLGSESSPTPAPLPSTSEGNGAAHRFDLACILIFLPCCCLIFCRPKRLKKESRHFIMEI